MTVHNLMVYSYFNGHSDTVVRTIKLMNLTRLISV